jgi:hypothetical protein
VLQWFGRLEACLFQLAEVIIGARWNFQPLTTTASNLGKMHMLVR